LVSAPGLGPPVGWFQCTTCAEDCILLLISSLAQECFVYWISPIACDVFSSASLISRAESRLVSLPPNFDFESSVLVWIVTGRSRYSSWVTGSKDSRFHGSNCTPAATSWTRSPVVWWNTCEDINCSLIRFLLSISHVVLLAPFRVSVVLPNPVPRADSSAIAVRSWPS
jgi:hypothetical protein